MLGVFTNEGRNDIGQPPGDYVISFVDEQGANESRMEVREDHPLMFRYIRGQHKVHRHLHKQRPHMPKLDLRKVLPTLIRHSITAFVEMASSLAIFTHVSWTT